MVLSMLYSDGFRSRMVQRMTGPEAISATALSVEVGVSQPTLSRWLKQARTVVPMVDRSDETGKPKSTRQWTAEERRRVVAEAAGLSDAELGAFLRGKGIHMAELEQWRAERDSAETATPKKKRTRLTSEQRRIRELEKQLQDSEKQLEKERKLRRSAEALLNLQKKVQEIWGGGDDDTPTRSGT